MDPVRVGQYIKKLRIENGLTQKEFADRLGVTYQAVSKWENGKNLPDISLLQLISLLFHVNIDDLLSGEEKNYLLRDNKKRKVKNNNVLLVILGVILILAVGLIIYFINKDSSFEFKTIKSSCEEFTLTGSAAYNQDKTFIYISDVDYCGQENDTIYQEFHCTLYEEYKDTKTKVGTCGDVKEKMKLEEFLDTIEINVNNYVASCKMFTSSSLYLEIQALNESDQNITYHIPIELEENCKK